MMIRLALNLTLLLLTPLPAHEPLFGLGPHTIYEGGYAFESEIESEAGSYTNHFELLYGITPDWAVTIALPYVFDSNGFGQTTLRTKYRFFRQDLKGGSRQAALHTGIILPTANSGNNVSDYFAGVSIGYESRRHYFFSSVRYRYNSSSVNMERGNVLKYDVAYGIRPWLLHYLRPDPVFLIEFNGYLMDKNIVNKTTVQNSGGSVLSLSPGLLFSYRNIMLKAGLKIPVYNGLNGQQPAPNITYVAGLEFHFPPLY